METIQHLIIHSLSLIENGMKAKEVKNIIEEGTIFSMENIPDILQLQVFPKSKYPTHFVENSYMEFGIKDEKIFLKNYKNSINKNIVKYKMNYNNIFKYNKNHKLEYLIPICEHIFLDKVTEDMFFLRFFNYYSDEKIISRETGKIINSKHFIEAKKYIYLLISRKYLKKLENYSIIINDEIIENFCMKIKNVYQENCWIAGEYLKKHYNEVINKSLSNDYCLEQIKDIISQDKIDKEIELQIQIGREKLITIINSKTEEELEKNFFKIIN